MRGQKILQFMDENHNGRRPIMEKNRADIKTDAGTPMKQAQERVDNYREALYGQQVWGGAVVGGQYFALPCR